MWGETRISGTPQIFVRVSSPLPPTREMWGPGVSPRVRGDRSHVSSPLDLKREKGPRPSAPAAMVSCLARLAFLPSNPEIPGSLGLRASAPSLEPRPHRVADLPSAVSSSAEPHTYPVRVLREPVHLLRPPRHGCSLREGERGRTRRGLVAAGLRERLGLATRWPSRVGCCHSPSARGSQGAPPPPKRQKLCGASVCEEPGGKPSPTRLGRAEGPAAPPEAGGVGGAEREEAGPPHLGGRGPGG